MGRAPRPLETIDYRGIAKSKRIDFVIGRKTHSFIFILMITLMFYSKFSTLATSHSMLYSNGSSHSLGLNISITFVTRRERPSRLGLSRSRHCSLCSGRCRTSGESVRSLESKRGLAKSRTFQISIVSKTNVQTVLVGSQATKPYQLLTFQARHRRRSGRIVCRATDSTETERGRRRSWSTAALSPPTTNSTWK
jgi:hypothetical protein